MKKSHSLALAFVFGASISAVAFAADAAAPAAAPAPGASATTPARGPGGGRGAQQPQPPTRTFDAPGAPKFTRLENKPGVTPPADAVGNYVVGPDYTPAPETKVIEGVPQGKVVQFVMDSKDSKFYPKGLSRTQVNPETGVRVTFSARSTRTTRRPSSSKRTSSTSREPSPSTSRRNTCRARLRLLSSPTMVPGPLVREQPRTFLKSAACSII